MKTWPDVPSRSMSEFAASPQRLRASLARFLEAIRPAAMSQLVAQRVSALGASGTRLRLGFERWRGGRGAPGPRDRVLATICWTFPIYSQTFVYEELWQLLRADFDVRLVYSQLEGREQLPEAFERLWEVKRRSFLDPRTAAADFLHYQRRLPERVAALIDLLRRASGFSLDQLTGDPHFLMAFSYARLAEAYRPDYLHSYFFYEGTLFTLVASQLLQIPRGVSCYADHMLQDYPLKLVPLHLQTSDVVVATSARIRQELLSLHPTPNAANILVKPNAIDTARFPVVVRTEPSAGEPFRLLCVARFEPKKGLIDLVEAIPLARNRGCRVELHLIGADDGSPGGTEYLARLRGRIDELQLCDVVVLDGRRSPEEVRQSLGVSHVFVAPFVELESGDKDGIPTALLEAMSTGAPILTTDAGSITEPIHHDVNGVVVAQRSPAALAEALVGLLENPERRAALGAEAARTVRARYDVRGCDHLLHDRIRAVLADRRALRR